MYVNEEKFNALLELVKEMKIKLEMYEKCENEREKEFRELEREVFRLKSGTEELLKELAGLESHITQKNRDNYRDIPGTAWLR